MLTRLTGVRISQHTHLWNHYVLPLKRILCSLPSISQFLKKIQHLGAIWEKEDAVTNSKLGTPETLTLKLGNEYFLRAVTVQNYLDQKRKSSQAARRAVRCVDMAREVRTVYILLYLFKRALPPTEGLNSWLQDQESYEELHFVNHAAQHFFSEENGRPASWPPSLYCAFLLWVWLLFFLLLFELIQRGLTFLNVLVWGETLFGCFSVVRAWSLSGGVSVRASMAWAYLSPVDTLTYIPCLLGMSDSLKTFAASWENSCEWALPELPLWAGRGLPHTQPCHLAQRHPLTSGTSVCTGRLCRVQKRLGTSAPEHTNFSFTGFGVHRALLIQTISILVT